MAIPIFQSKFRVPTYSAVLRRERLFARLDDAATCPLTLVCADAGYGKTTLVATYLTERQHPALWIRLDILDRQLDVLFAHLCAGLADHFPACQPRLAALATRLGQHRRSPAELAADLVAAIESSSREQLMIVLNDFESVQESAEVVSAIHHLTLLLPETVRLFILSRVRPTGLPLARLSLDGRLTELTRSDLAFTREETRQLFADVYDMALSSGEEQVLHASCEGWPAGLSLVREALRRADTPKEREDFWQGLARSSDIFQYLLSETMAGLPTDTQDFLLRTSALASLEPSITDALLNRTDSHQLLERLERAQLFIYAEGAERTNYRYHTLFRRFLRHQHLQRDGAEAARDLHQRAASLYEQRGDYNHAVAHYLAARDFISAARVMSRVVEAYPPRTFLHLFDGWLERQAPDARMAYSSIFIRRVLPLETLERLAPALEELLTEAKSAGDLASQANAHHRLAIVSFYHCDIPAARAHYEQAVELFRKLHDPVMEALSLSDLGHLFWLEGDAAQARARCDQSLELCEQHRLTMPRMQCLWRLASIALGVGDLERAEQTARIALEIGGEKEDVGASTYPTMILASVASARGEHAAAIRLAHQAIEYSQASGIRVDRGWGALCAGTAYLRSGDQATAERFLTEATRLVAGYLQPELAASARLAALYLRQGELDAARQKLARALEIARMRGLDHLLALELFAYPALLVFALENDLTTDYLLTLIDKLPDSLLEPVHRLLAEPGQPHRRALAHALGIVGANANQIAGAGDSSRARATFELEFKTLGRFAVRSGKTDLTPELKRRRSCRRLLLFLLAERQRAVPREQIVEALWPAVSPASGENRFHIALSWLRRILEPDITSGSDSQIIVREEDRYRLATEICQIDADEFSQLASAPMRAYRRVLSARQEQALLRATALYEGDFLQEYPYEEFLNGERDGLRETQRAALVRLGDHYRARRQADRALQCYQGALALDPCREEVHRRIIFAHLLANDSAMATRAWQDCVKIMRHELAVVPSPTTQAVARRMLGI